MTTPQKNKRFVLTRDNYYSVEADRRLMSVSQYKGFLKCEAEQMALLSGDYVQPPVQAFLEGNFLHSWAESPEAHQEFIKNTPELYKQRGAGMLARYQKIEDSVIPLLEADPKFMKVLEGEKEKIIRVKFLGIEWKARIDVYNPEKGYFVDLKYINNPYKAFFSKKHETYVDFVTYYQYDVQMVVYAELEKIKYKRKEPLNPYILAVSKDEKPITMLIGNLLDYREEILEEVKQNLERINQVKNGEVEPKACGRCDYCRSNAKLVAYPYKLIPID